MIRYSHPLVIYSQQYFHCLYRWNANVEYDERLDSVVADCSGFVLKCLADAGLLLADMTANGLYHYCLKHGHGSGIEEGNLLFYGKSENSITHVAIALSETHLVECGGAGRNSLKMKKWELIAKDARVRIKPIGHRKDFLCGLKII